MADDLNLEVTEQPGPPAAPIEPPAPPPDPDEAVAVEVAGAKHVPLSALKAVREELKVAKEKAGKVDALEQWQRDAAPYVEFVQKNPQLIQPQPPAPQQGDDPALVEIAQTYDFYKVGGGYDLDKARRHQTNVRKEAQAIAQQVVGPVAMTNYNSHAEANWKQAVSQKLPNGAPIDHKMLAAAWTEVGRQNPAILADPKAVQVIVSTVKMAQMEANPIYQQPAAPGRPPVVTENVGARPGTNNKMNDTQRAIVANRGIDDKKFGELTAGFTSGRMNVLED